MIHRCQILSVVIGALAHTPLVNEVDYVYRFGKRWNGAIAYVNDDGDIVEGFDPDDEIEIVDTPDYVSPMMLEVD